MQFYTNGSSGCLILLIIFICIMMVAGWIFKILFTTPLGMILLVFILISYLIKTEKKSNISEQNSNVEFDNQQTKSSVKSDFVSRDAEDVYYEEVDDE